MTTGELIAAGVFGCVFPAWLVYVYRRNLRLRREAEVRSWLRRLTRLQRGLKE